jgi:5-methyltetrahydrofolate--homocysteine methyltransferase
MVGFKEIQDALIKADHTELIKLVKGFLERGVPANDILNRGLIAAMEVVGERMENQEMFIPEVLQAARAMTNAIELLKPMLAKEGVAAKGIVVIGTVKGDLHDIGKNLVAMMCESVGFEVHNMGVDIAPEQFIKTVKEKKADILMLSALLTTTMPMMKKTIEIVTENGLRNAVKILVGGAPVDHAYADKIGADGYAPEAARLAKSFFK